MQVDLLSGVVRNRKMAAVTAEQEIESKRFLSFDSEGDTGADHPFWSWHTLYSYVSGTALFRNLSFRVHRFVFQWNLSFHLSIGVFSLSPFFFSGHRLIGCIPIAVWTYYNILFLISTRQAEKFINNFGKLKAAFKNSMEEFMTPRLLPVMSISLMLVTLSLAVTGRRLGGPPLCYRPCSQCLAMWDNAIPISNKEEDRDSEDPEWDPHQVSCGFYNGKELMGFYTMTQTSFLLFIATIAALAGCMAWKVANEEVQERQAAEAWLKREDQRAFKLREELIKLFGPPGAAIRPEANALWVVFGIIAAITFTLLGWHNWYVLPPSNTATLLIVLNILTILMSTLMLHLGFFGRLLALYKRNFLRVEYLTHKLELMGADHVDEWWNCRNFVLNDDLALDYDIGGLAVSLTFILNLAVFFVLCMQIYEYGFGAIMTPPGSYCGYACLYLTMCLIKIFTLATSTFEEQHAHIATLQGLSQELLRSQRQLHGVPGDGHYVVKQQAHEDAQQSQQFAAGGGPEMQLDNVDGYDVEDYGAYYELSPRASAQNVTVSGATGGTSLGDVGGAAEGAAEPAFGYRNKQNQSYSLYGYADEYQEIYMNLTPAEREAEREREVAYEEEKERDRLRTLSQEHDNLLDMFRKNDIHMSVRPSTIGEGSNEQLAGGSSDVPAPLSADTGSGAEPKPGISVPPSISLPVGGASKKTTPRAVHSSNSANSSPRGLAVKKTLSTQDEEQRDDIEASYGQGSAEAGDGKDGTVTRGSFGLFSYLGLSPKRAKSIAGEREPLVRGGENTVSNESATTSTNSISSGPPSRAHSYKNLSSVSSAVGSTGVSSSGTVSANNLAGAYSKPVLGRNISANAGVESKRQTLAEMVSQIRKYDPYPCILGIPVMPALFQTSKFYIFLGFLLIGSRVMISCMRIILD